MSSLLTTLHPARWSSSLRLSAPRRLPTAPTHLSRQSTSTALLRPSPILRREDDPGMLASLRRTMEELSKATRYAPGIKAAAKATAKEQARSKLSSSAGAAASSLSSDAPTLRARWTAHGAAPPSASAFEVTGAVPPASVRRAANHPAASAATKRRAKLPGHAARMREIYRRVEQPGVALAMAVRGEGRSSGKKAGQAVVAKNVQRKTPTRRVGLPLPVDAATRPSSAPIPLASTRLTPTRPSPATSPVLAAIGAVPAFTSGPAVRAEKTFIDGVLNAPQYFPQGAKTVTLAAPTRVKPTPTKPAPVAAPRVEPVPTLAPKPALKLASQPLGVAQPARLSKPLVAGTTVGQGRLSVPVSSMMPDERDIFATLSAGQRATVPGMASLTMPQGITFEAKTVEVPRKAGIVKAKAPITRNAAPYAAAAPPAAPVAASTAPTRLAQAPLPAIPSQPLPSTRISIPSTATPTPAPRRPAWAVDLPTHLLFDSENPFALSKWFRPLSLVARQAYLTALRTYQDINSFLPFAPHFLANASRNERPKLLARLKQRRVMGDVALARMPALRTEVAHLSSIHDLNRLIPDINGLTASFRAGGVCPAVHLAQLSQFRQRFDALRHRLDPSVLEGGKHVGRLSDLCIDGKIPLFHDTSYSSAALVPVDTLLRSFGTRGVTRGPDPQGRLGRVVRRKEREVSEALWEASRAAAAA
ncbi:hypothetical protein JCM10207_003451 [Rhodosporidiobolus poonsookiae]